MQRCSLQHQSNREATIHCTNHVVFAALLDLFGGRWIGEQFTACFVILVVEPGGTRGTVISTFVTAFLPGLHADGDSG